METNPWGETTQTDQELAAEIRIELERLEHQRVYLEDLLLKLEDTDEPLGDSATDL